MESYDAEANADQPAFDEAKDHYLLPVFELVSAACEETLEESGARAVQLHREGGGRQNERSERRCRMLKSNG